MKKDDVNIFSELILNPEIELTLYVDLIAHFTNEMHKAVKGKICTRERMAKLYPIFREINVEMDEIKAELGRDRKRQNKRSRK